MSPRARRVPRPDGSEGAPAREHRAVCGAPGRKLRVAREEDPDATLAWVVAERVRKYRVESGWRQEDLADRTGIARPNIARLERGRHLPTLSTLRRIAEALGVSLPGLLVVPTEGALEEDRDLAEADLEGWDHRVAEEDHRP